MQTISLPVLEAGEYAGGIWYYEPHTYQSYRYVLGRVGKHPLVCIGINPSTAQPGALDPTLKSVERLAAANGFDSWIMFNVYPQRATDPNDMDKIPDRALCDENLRWLRADFVEKAMLGFGDLASAPVDALAAMVGEKDAPKIIAQGVLDLARLPGEGEEVLVTVPLFRPKLVKGQTGSLTLAVRG